MAGGRTSGTRTSLGVCGAGNDSMPGAATHHACHSPAGRFWSAVRSVLRACDYGISRERPLLARQSWSPGVCIRMRSAGLAGAAGCAPLPSGLREPVALQLVEERTPSDAEQPGGTGPVLPGRREGARDERAFGLIDGRPDRSAVVEPGLRRDG